MPGPRERATQGRPRRSGAALRPGWAASGASWGLASSLHICRRLSSRPCERRVIAPSRWTTPYTGRSAWPAVFSSSMRKPCTVRSMQSACSSSYTHLTSLYLTASVSGCWMLATRLRNTKGIKLLIAPPASSNALKRQPPYIRRSLDRGLVDPGDAEGEAEASPTDQSAFKKKLHPCERQPDCTLHHAQ